MPATTRTASTATATATATPLLLLVASLLLVVVLGAVEVMGLSAVDASVASSSVGLLPGIMFDFPGGDMVLPLFSSVAVVGVEVGTVVAVAVVVVEEVVVVSVVVVVV